MLLLPGKRLSAAAEFIRRGAVFADIGTDHALLPIWAVTNGVAVHAVASDVNEGPLRRACENAARYGVGSRVSCVLANGFDGMESYGITDAAICGMGGELIADIVERATFIKSEGVRLIVQPMTMPDAARRGLWRAGFAITDELTVCEGDKYYTVICADYCGGVHNEFDNFTALYGDIVARRFESDDVRTNYFKHEIGKYEQIIKGKSSAGLDVSAEQEIIRRLAEVM